jgi:HNH endonuclease
MSPEEVETIRRKISHGNVVSAIEERRRLGKLEFRKKYGFGPARQYLLVYEGDRFDSKAILGVAAQFVVGSSGPFTPRDIYGGTQTKALLESLGFQVTVEDIGALALPNEAADETSFDPQDVHDARERIRRTIVQRRGQNKFRNALIVAYGSRCAISGCTSIEVLEAAHIYPYSGPDTNHVANGLLLRADLHTLFDLGIVRIDPKTFKVLIDKKLTDRGYRQFHDKKLRLPNSVSDYPSRTALTKRIEDEKT